MTLPIPPPEPAAPDVPELTPEQAAAIARHNQAVEQQVKLRSRRAFVGLGLVGLAGALGWRWLLNTPPVDGLPGGLRKILDANGELASAYFKHARLAPEFPKSRAEKLRFNGRVGLSPGFEPAAWRLTVQGYSAPGAPPRTQEFTLADLRALPRTEMTTEFKCIEGWSQIVTWAGVRLSDFLTCFPLATTSGRPADPARPPADLAPYVSLVTPDEKYFVGLDIKSALHPQTLLCYEMNGAPLTLPHGAPLRLVSPLKYGVKHIKRIGTIAFMAERPADYWAKLGYDWHAGH
ncbi:MAG: molybdopterin-dependent oxidoreductase [Hymenobacteraceae bacterium]|nr:molybdopterin-dependent oxidoreductase [Hymenobacteraceae bacterium]